MIWLTVYNFCEPSYHQYERERARSSRWWHRPFLSSVALTRRPPRSSLLWGWAQGILCTTETEKDHNGKLWEAATVWPHHPPPANASPNGSFRAYAFSSRGGEARWISSSISIVRHFQGESFGSHFTGLIRDQIKIWAYSNQCSYLGRLHSSLQVHLSRDYSQHLCHL